MSRSRSVKIRRFLLQVHLQFVSARCAADMHLTTGKWCREETCKFVFFIYSVLISPKNVSDFFFWYFLCEEFKANRSHACVFIFLGAPHDVLTSLQLSAECGQNNTVTSRKCLRFVVCVCVCMCVDSSFSFVFVLFLFCLCFVSVCFCQFSVDPAQRASGYILQ